MSEGVSTHSAEEREIHNQVAEDRGEEFVEENEEVILPQDRLIGIRKDRVLRGYGGRRISDAPKGH